MNLSRLALLALLFASFPAFSSGDEDDAETTEPISFILDVSAYEGMFYSVYDFCASITNLTVAELSKARWKEKNEDLLVARDLAERKYLMLMRGRGVEGEASAKLKETKKDTFIRAHDHNRLYKDILPLEDKYIACAQRLGEMLSDSMSFEKVAPKSHKYRLAHREP
jgi:hypothetical protein